MSLVKLLAVGRCLDTVRDIPGRYRIARLRALPRFRPPESIGRYQAGGATGVGVAPKGSRTSAKALEDVHSYRQSGIPNARTNLLAALLGYLWGKTVCAAKALCKSPKQIVLINQLRALCYRRGSAKGGLASVPGQRELFLANIKVVRNDLSDADGNYWQPSPRGKRIQTGSPPEKAPSQHAKYELLGQLTWRVFRVPEGFQDKAGFHFGTQNGLQEIEWPPFW